MQRIVDLGIPIVSNQVQFPDRPASRGNMTNFCRQHGVHLLTYGTLCGGLLSERYLNQPEPAYRDLNTSSLQKYKRMIDAWGGWALFQELLAVVKGVADRNGMSIADVGLRYVLDRPSVAGVIVGVRLGLADHREDNARVFDFSLTRADTDEIENVLARSSDLYRIIGDCGDEYRH
jgi:aryl-alcohol dehydrogenase-like predicted oxidoreductase